MLLSISEIYKSRAEINNVYLHLPFCRNKCHFCAFPVHAIGNKKDGDDEIFQRYLSALKQEIQIGRSYTNIKSHLNTLYFGGGTPSLLKPSNIKELIKEFPTNQHTEITLEVNPSEICSI